MIDKKCEELLMKAKPILFNTEMVRAILDGRKTVTRRVVKPQPLAKIAYCLGGSGAGKWIYPGDSACEIWEDEDYRLPDGLPDNEKDRRWMPPCNTDDILYVRETWCKGSMDYGIEQCYYKADDNNPLCKWHPSIHMPKEAARIFLKVTNVRVERLQDITPEQCVAEGAEKLISCPQEHAVIEPDGTLGDMCWNTDCCGEHCEYIEKSYGELFGKFVWNSTIKKSDIDKYGWNANPWVWVIEFEGGSNR